MTKRYLYFTVAGALTANGDLAMVPIENIRGFGQVSSSADGQATNETRLIIKYTPRDGTITAEDAVVVEFAAGDKQRVIKSLVSIINGDKNKSPFFVAADSSGGVMGIDGVTACVSIQQAI